MEGGDIPAEAAEALLVIIPKEMQPSTLKGFRPLSLCNTVFKLVSKIVDSRLKEAWKVLISPYQVSFIHGYQSSNNVIICQEFVHYMRFTKAKKGAVVNKLIKLIWKKLMIV